MNFRTSTNKEIARVVKNFNQKVSRLEKLGRENLPEKVRIKDLKSNIYSSSDLKRELNKLKRFSSRGAEDVLTNYGAPITKWEKRNIGIQVRTAKSKITRQLKSMGIPKNSWQTTKRRLQVGKQATDTAQTLINQYQNLSVKNILSQKTKNSQQEKLNILEKIGYRYSNRAVFVLQQSLLEMIEKLDVSKENKKTKEILKDKIKKLSINELKKIYYNYDEINDVIFRYKLEQEGLNLDYGDATNEEILNRLMTVLS